MLEETTFREQELRELSKYILTQFSDRSVRGLLEDKENVRGLIEILVPNQQQQDRIIRNTHRFYHSASASIIGYSS